LTVTSSAPAAAEPRPLPCCAAILILVPAREIGRHPPGAPPGISTARSRKTTGSQPGHEERARDPVVRAERALPAHWGRPMIVMDGSIVIGGPAVRP